MSGRLGFNSRFCSVSPCVCSSAPTSQVGLRATEHLKAPHTGDAPETAASLLFHRGFWGLLLLLACSLLRKHLKLKKTILKQERSRAVTGVSAVTSSLDH